MTWVQILAALLPWLTRAALVWAAANGVNTAQAVSYGAPVDLNSLWGVVLPLLTAAASHGGTIKLNQIVQSVTGSSTAAQLAEITAILGLRDIAKTDASFQKTANTLAHQWVDASFGPVTPASTS